MYRPPASTMKKNQDLCIEIEEYVHCCMCVEDVHIMSNVLFLTWVICSSLFSALIKAVLLGLPRFITTSDARFTRLSGSPQRPTRACMLSNRVLSSSRLASMPVFFLSKCSDASCRRQPARTTENNNAADDRWRSRSWLGPPSRGGRHDRPVYTGLSMPTIPSQAVDSLWTVLAPPPMARGQHPGDRCDPGHGWTHKNASVQNLWGWCFIVLNLFCTKILCCGTRWCLRPTMPKLQIFLTGST